VGGHRVALIAEGRYPAGRHVAEWDIGAGGHSHLARGIYFVRLVTSAGVRTQRVVLL
jgi:hypothetical protein